MLYDDPYTAQSVARDLAERHTVLAIDHERSDYLEPPAHMVLTIAGTDTDLHILDDWIVDDVLGTVQYRSLTVDVRTPDGTILDGVGCECSDDGLTDLDLFLSDVL